MRRFDEKPGAFMQPKNVFSLGKCGTNHFQCVEMWKKLPRYFSFSCCIYEPFMGLKRSRKREREKASNLLSRRT